MPPATNRFLAPLAAGGLLGLAALAWAQPPQPATPSARATFQPGALAPLLDEVSPDALMATIRGLENFGTRHTLSETESDTRGIGAARRWLLKEFEAIGGGLQPALESFELPPGVRLPSGATVVNVVAVLPGTMPGAADRAYYVVGHYDSRNADVMDAVGDAPGANDDASGTAIVVEIARLLAARPLESTIVFLCTAGEEQGLLGARAHASNLTGAKAWRLCTVLSNDIVGDPIPSPAAGGIDAWPSDLPATADLRAAAEGPDPRRMVRVFSEGIPRNPSSAELARIRTLSAENDSPSRQLARYIADVAQIERLLMQPMPIFRPDRFLRGGDHSSFNEVGHAAVRFTTLHEDYSRQHADVVERNGKPYGDTAEFVDAEYLAEVTRLNLAALVHLANAPSPPTGVRFITAGLSPSTTLRWSTSPEPDVAGYEVVWRDTTQWQWEHVLDVGNRTEVTLPINKDNVFFGLRAYDRDGFRSPVTFAGAADR
jgi:hypothetical protein